MRCLLPSLLAVGLFCAGTPSRAGPRIVSPGDPTVSDVVAVAAEFMAKIADGDRDGAYELFAGSGDDRNVLEAQLRFVAASDEFLRSRADRVGKHDLELKQSPARIMLHRLSEREAHEAVVLDGDSACTAIGLMSNAGLELHRFGVRWKVIHISADPTRTKKLLAYYSAMSDLMNHLCAKTETDQTDQFSRRDAAAKELDDRMLALGSASFWDSKSSPPASQPAAVAPPADLGTASALFDHLGASMTSPQMTAIIDSLPPLPRLAGLPDSIYVNSYELGISLSFRLPGAGLQAVHLYAEGQDGFRQYRGSLPERLTLTMSRGEVEARLGRPNKMRAGYSYYPRLGLSITYASRARQDYRDSDNRIAAVTLTAPVPDAPPPPLPPKGAPPWLTFRIESDHPGGDVVAFPSDPAGVKVMFVSHDALFDETSVETAALMSPDMTPDKRWHLEIKLTPEAGLRLSEVSQANIGRRMAMVLGGRVVVAPVIRDKISDRFVVDLGKDAGGDAYRKLADEIGTALFSLPPPAGPVRLGPE
jgi:hypothetical protein